MKVLITGAAGQLGRALIESAPPDIRLTAYSRADLDIADELATFACVRRHAPDLIINAAAYTAVDRAESEPDLARRVNVDGPALLAAAARKMRARLIHISTDFVFDGAAAVPYAPDAPTNPLNVYGRTKRDGENAVMDVLNGRAVILRTAWVYASTGRNFVRTMLRVMRASKSVRVVADQVGTPTSAQSLAAAIWQIAVRPQLGGIHHWTDAGIASWYDFAVAMAEEAVALGLISPEVTVTPIATREYPTPARRPAYSVLDKSSLAAAGITPIHWRKRLRAVLGEIRDV